jgi:hypothetical protein
MESGLVCTGDCQAHRHERERIRMIPWRVRLASIGDGAAVECNGGTPWLLHPYRPSQTSTLKTTFV